VLSALLRQGLRRGLLGGSRAWLAVGVAAGLLRVLRRVTRQEPEVVWCGEVPPGHRLEVRHRPPPG
jgi:hypothetical protein